MKNNYYVYEWIRLDTNEVFYVGKGKNERAYELKEGRNKHFKSVIKNRNVAVVLLHENLTEEEALQYECWYIHEYKYLIGLALTNKTDGGEGVSGWYNGLSDEEKLSYGNNMKKVLKKRYVEKPELRKTVTKKMVEFMKTQKQREVARIKGKEKHKNNPEYFKEISLNYWEKESSRIKAREHIKKLWNDEETRNKILLARKNSNKFKKNVHEANSIRFSGGGNPNSKKVTLNINGEIFKFSCKKEAISYLNKINIQLIHERTGKPVKKVSENLFNKKISKNPYTDYKGNIISLV